MTTGGGAPATGDGGLMTAERYAVIHADLLAHLRGNRWMVQNGHIEKAHAVLCDPPYGLEFMGKEWDRPKPSGLFHVPAEENRVFTNASGHYFDNMRKPLVRFSAGVDFEAWVREWAELLLDYVHPGAVGLFFGGTRTYHRLAAGLEDAGWEIADSLMWVYAQGFPKSAAIGKLLDKEAGAVGTLGGYKSKDHAAQRKPGSERLHEGWQRPWMEDEEKRDAQGRVYLPATPLAARWVGYGTALKPAYETVVVCRAPRGKHTYAALAREFGTGAINIDGGRVQVTDGAVLGRFNKDGDNGWKNSSGGPTRATYDPVAASGRWPSNFALVCACEGDDHADDCPVRQFPNDEARFFYVSKAAAWEREAGLSGFALRENPTAAYSAMKVVNQTRNDGGENVVLPRRNHHPTVKPIRLAEYLARLILPPEGDGPRRLLVPFAGSGSEMIGALLAGWDVVTGIEREAEYIELARARVGWWSQFATYDDARAAYEQERKAKPAPAPIPEPVVVEDAQPEQLALFDEGAA